MGFLLAHCSSVKTNRKEPRAPPLSLAPEESRSIQSKGVSFLGWVFLSESVDKNMTIAFVLPMPEGMEMFTPACFETLLELAVDPTVTRFAT